MATKQDMQFCATRIPRQDLKVLRDVAWHRSITLKELLYNILTEFAKTHRQEVNA
jgi:hypothetical protein